MTIVDCAGEATTYRLLKLRSDFGPRAWDLVNVDYARFGDAHQVLFDDSGHWNCSCKGFTYRDICKHVISLAALLLAGEKLP
jgi:hypothetical protein